MIKQLLADVRTSQFSLMIAILAAAGVSLSSGTAEASGNAGSTEADSGHGPKIEKPVLKPATRYSGNSPIDLTNGMTFNNGTFGLPNEAYEEWAKSNLVVPGLSEKTYPFTQKADFIRGMEESVQFIEAAIENWKQTSADTKPEAVEYSKKAVETLTPLLEKTREAIVTAKKIGKGDWEKAQSSARQTLIDARVAYWQLHKNPRK
jgi:hypothetical protein